MPTTDPSGMAEVSDDEQAIRLLLPEWCPDGQVTGAAFFNRPPDNPKRREISVFVQDRLPSRDGSVLHVGELADRGRARLIVGALRSVTYLKSDVPTPAEFDVSMTWKAEPPLEAYGDAHGHVTGPTHNKKAASALANAFNVHGHLDKIPVKSPGPPPESSQFQ